jgi:hypothetical protein
MLRLLHILISHSKPMTQSKIKKAVDDYVANRHNEDLKRNLTDLGDGVYTGTNHRVTVSTWIPLRFDVAAFKAQHPDLYAKFLLQDEPVQFARINHR